MRGKEASEVTNKLYVTAHLGENDLRSLSRSLSNMAGVQEIAEEMGIRAELSREDLDRDLTVFVPTKRLEAFLGTVKGAGHWHGTIDIYSAEALQTAEKAGCEQIVDMRSELDQRQSAM